MLVGWRRPTTRLRGIERSSSRSSRTSSVGRSRPSADSPVPPCRTTTGSNDGERREFLELIRQEADRLERVVEQVALALKLDVGAVTFDRRPADVTAVVRGAAEAVTQAPTRSRSTPTTRRRATVDVAQLATAVRELVRTPPRTRRRRADRGARAVKART